ncbi:hypothetical protein ACTMTI_30365 [Nonomuraea sp. H19]|uniref:hypothetical protein n=1 Tax=Nonomuraea sp. H19 TaxID=3452206 RepID=UPI003F88C2BD
MITIRLRLHRSTSAPASSPSRWDGAAWDRSEVNAQRAELGAGWAWRPPQPQWQVF